MDSPHAYPSDGPATLKKWSAGDSPSPRKKKRAGRVKLQPASPKKQKKM